MTEEQKAGIDIDPIKLEEAANAAKPAEEQKEPDFVKFDYGHLINQCFKCGHKKIMDRDVEGGLSLFLPTTDKHEMKLVCENCKNSMSMYFIKSDKVKPPEEAAQGDLVVDEKKTKRKRKVTNEVSKGSKKKKSIPTDSKSA